MIISRTPFRISFFGGGTDIPAFFCEEGGQVLSTSIDKYCYVTVRHLPPFFQHSIRLAYSRIELCREFKDIQHPLIRVALEDFNQNQVEIHYDADLPGNSGLGSSSAFGVGLASCLSTIQGKKESKQKLAERVIRWERYVLNETGGYQDQIAASYGGMNRIKFHTDCSFTVNPYLLTLQDQQEFARRMILCYIPKTRLSCEISVGRHINEFNVRSSLRFIKNSVDEGLRLLQSRDFDGFGKLLHENWIHKRSFKGVTDVEIDSVYGRALKAGALGGKLLGAGGGGFMLIWCKDDNRLEVVQSLNPLLVVPIGLDIEGSKVIYTSDSSRPDSRSE